MTVPEAKATRHQTQHSRSAMSGDTDPACSCNHIFTCWAPARVARVTVSLGASRAAFLYKPRGAASTQARDAQSCRGRAGDAAHDAPTVPRASGSARRCGHCCARQGKPRVMQL